MRIYKNTKLKKKHYKGVLAIGNFDGVHVGHQKVIRQAKNKAKKNKIPFGIMTFEPIPVMYFDRKIKNHRINSLYQKKTQFKKLKIDFLIIVKFNEKFSKLTAEQFIEKIIFKKTNSKYLYVSENFKFGFKRKGNIKTLKKFEKKFKYKNLVTTPLKRSNKVISSTFIREKIRSGKIIEPKSRKTTIYEFENIANNIADNSSQFRILCSKGTYIRSISRDLAYSINNVAYTTYLKRTKIGNYNQEDGTVSIYPFEGSGRVSSLSWSNGIIELSEFEQNVEKGDLVDFIPYQSFF